MDNQKSDRLADSLRPDELNKGSETAPHPTDRRSLEICGIVQDLIPLYADGIAGRDSQKLIESHISDCPDCADLLEQAEQSLSVCSVTDDQKMESALKTVNGHFHRHRMMLTALLVLCAALFLGSAFLLERYTRVSADEITSRLYASSPDQKTLELISRNGPLFGLNIKDQGNGNYLISAQRWKEETSSVRTLSLSDPVQSIRFNQNLIWIDGITITPECRQLYPFANGYAGSTGQMSLARPDFPGMEFHIEADTRNPDHSIWKYSLDSDEDRLNDLDAGMKQAWIQKALLALALTPNLQDIQLLKANEEPFLSVGRSRLDEILDSAHLPAVIHSQKDLQQIMNAVLEPTE